MKFPFPRFLFPALALLLAGPCLLQARSATDWTLEDVLFKIEEANGGIDTINAISDIRALGKIETEGLTFDFVLLRKRPDRVRLHLFHRGRSIETGYDGSRGWRRRWEGNLDEVKVLTDEEFRETSLDLDFDGPLIGPPMPGVKRRLLGTERVDRVDYFIVEVESPLSRTLHYIDPRTFREWKTVRRDVEGDGREKEVVTTYSQYRRMGPLWLAERAERATAGRQTEVMLITRAEINTGLLDLAFAMPRPWAERSEQR